MDTTEREIDITNADSARFREAIENMAYGYYRRIRELRPERPISYFEDVGLWSAEEVGRFEARFQAEARK